MEKVKLVDQFRSIVATADVADEGANYGGAIDLTSTPAGVRALFEEFEEIVNGQMFAFLDEVQERIAALRLKAVFDSGRAECIKDLQVFPSTGDVSFKLAEVAMRHQ